MASERDGSGLAAAALHLDGDVSYFGRMTRKWRSRYLVVHGGELAWWETHENAHAPPAGAGSGSEAGAAAAAAGDSGGVAPDWQPTTKPIGSVPLAGMVFAAVDAELVRAVRSALGGPDDSGGVHPVVSALRGGSGGDLGERRGLAMVLAYAAPTGIGPGMREPLVIAPASKEEALLWAVTLSTCVSGGTLPMSWVSLLAERYTQGRVAHARSRGGMALVASLAPLPPLPGLAAAEAPAPAKAAAAAGSGSDGVAEVATVTPAPAPASSSSSPPAPPPRPRTNTEGGGVPSAPPAPSPPLAASVEVPAASAPAVTAPAEPSSAATTRSRSGSWACAEDGVERQAMRKKIFEYLMRRTPAASSTSQAEYLQRVVVPAVEATLYADAAGLRAAYLDATTLKARLKAVFTQRAAQGSAASSAAPSGSETAPAPAAPAPAPAPAPAAPAVAPSPSPSPQPSPTLLGRRPSARVGPHPGASTLPVHAEGDERDDGDGGEAGTSLPPAAAHAGRDGDAVRRVGSGSGMSGAAADSGGGGRHDGKAEGTVTPLLAVGGDRESGSGRGGASGSRDGASRGDADAASAGTAGTGGGGGGTMHSRSYVLSSRWGSTPHPWLDPSSSTFIRGLAIKHYPAQADGGVHTNLILERRPDEPPPLSVLNKWQHRQCADCATNITTGFFGTRAIFCYYTELLFCSKCMAPEPRPIPWRVVHTLDDTQFAVSRVAAQFIDTVWEAPIIAMSAIAPRTLAKATYLRRISALRAKLADVIEHIAVTAARLDPAAGAGGSGSGAARASALLSEAGSPTDAAIGTSARAATLVREVRARIADALGPVLGFLADSLELLPLSIIVVASTRAGAARIEPRLAAAIAAAEEFAVHAGVAGGEEGGEGDAAGDDDEHVAARADAGGADIRPAAAPAPVLVAAAAPPPAPVASRATPPASAGAAATATRTASGVGRTPPRRSTMRGQSGAPSSGPSTPSRTTGGDDDDDSGSAPQHDAAAYEGVDDEDAEYGGGTAYRGGGRPTPAEAAAAHERAMAAATAARGRGYGASAGRGMLPPAHAIPVAAASPMMYGRPAASGASAMSGPRGSMLPEPAVAGGVRRTSTVPRGSLAPGHVGSMARSGGDGDYEGYDDGGDDGADDGYQYEMVEGDDGYAYGGSSGGGASSYEMGRGAPRSRPIAVPVGAVVAGSSLPGPGVSSSSYGSSGGYGGGGSGAPGLTSRSSWSQGGPGPVPGAAPARQGGPRGYTTAGGRRY